MESIAETLGASLVQSMLDYANSIMYGIWYVQTRVCPKKSLTRVVLPFIRYLTASELPVHCWIQFKIATLTYKTLAFCQPPFLYNLLQIHQPSRVLCSSDQQLLQVPYMSNDFGRHAFNYSSPTTWNSICTSIKNCLSLYSFKQNLKYQPVAQLINNWHISI